MASRLINLPIPLSLKDKFHVFNTQVLKQVVALSPRLYVHYFFHDHVSSLPPMDVMQSIISDTYHLLLEHNIQSESTVIPPRFGCDPSRYITDLSSVFYIKEYTSFNRDITEVNSDRTSKGLGRIAPYEVSLSSPPLTTAPSLSEPPRQGFVPSFDGVVLGGTFDRLHAGHKMMLTVASLLCKKHMEIGVTDQSLLQNKKYKELIQPFELRTSNVLEFVKLLNPDPNLNIVMLRLMEPYANTTTSTTLQAIVVSPETEKVGTHINNIRVSANLQPLEVVPIKYIPPPSHMANQPQLSSTLLRELDFHKQNNSSNN